MKFLIPLILVLSVLPGCKTSTMGPVASDNTEVPMNQKESCLRLCKDVEMELGGMVIITGRVGCICEVPKHQKATKSSAAASAGATVVLLEEEAAAARRAKQQENEERRRQEQRQRQQQRSTWGA